MKPFLLIALLLAIGPFTASAQLKVAEGEYRGVYDRGQPGSKVDSRWVLTRKSDGGYRLDSVVQSTSGGRVVQSEDLDEHLIPKSVAYSFYSQDKAKPAGMIQCRFDGDSIVCAVSSNEKADFAVSKPFKYRGPFWIWFSNLFALDEQWLLGGAINMAHLENGKSSIATITVDGGGDVEWYFSADEEQTVEFMGVETIEVDGIKVAARHYQLGSGEKPKSVWMAGEGILVKSTFPEVCENCATILANYRQSKRLIPELPVSEFAPEEPKRDRE